MTSHYILILDLCIRTCLFYERILITAFVNSMDADQTADNDKFNLGLYCLLGLAVLVFSGYNSILMFYLCTIYFDRVLESLLLVGQ